MADSDKNILITPNTGQSTEPKIEFVGSSSAPITLKVLDDNSLSWEGSQGQLFSITNNLSTGSIFSVNDISGVPSIEVNADGTVSLAEFSGNVGVGTSSPTYKFEVSGTLSSSIGLFANVGIGITNPTTILDVNGIVRGSRFQGVNNSSYYIRPDGTSYLSTTYFSTSATVNGFVQISETGIYAEGPVNTFNISSTGNSWFRQNVGIGITNPAELLDVRTTTATAGQGARIGEAKIGTWENNTDWAAFTHNSVHSTVNSYALMQNSSGRTLLNSAANQNLEFRIDNDTKMKIEPGGDVGIGTTSPGAKLEVNGNIKFTSAGQGIDFSANSNNAGMTSELLDDYEEGTWTATVNWGVGNAGGTITSRYVKIGELVYFEGGGSTAASATNTAGLIYITGLPFNVANSTNPIPAKYVGAAVRTGYVPTNSYLSTSEEILTAGRPYNGGSTQTVALFNYTSGTNYLITFAGCYRTTD